MSVFLNDPKEIVKKVFDELYPGYTYTILETFIFDPKKLDEFGYSVDDSNCEELVGIDGDRSYRISISSRLRSFEQVESLIEMLGHVVDYYDGRRQADAVGRIAQAYNKRVIEYHRMVLDFTPCLIDLEYLPDVVLDYARSVSF